ncbi:branched-chain amino acid transport system II carrier protein [Candidatus Pantoea edessiphila]|uniref:Branched-chain amino acid transport system carrier protein n=1 Tax=Candidatus Pantoea edessiphila TaxID=2044610 RepID=A0A2P5T1A8_9GAMM|nr:branched-chain amino acid transport system II carrier protein [Candidatus Pantoea edessiphila]PPI88384.1 branched-chain amino acid transport system II carrier protein [Candidatus Pantoea edessiphila]
MIKPLTLKNIIAFSFMTFALFVGAGNIVFPPMIGIQSGENIFISGFGYLITAVGLPICTIIALARSEGGMEALCEPVGKKAGLLLIIACYVIIGPLFALPRTAMISFQSGIEPLFHCNNTLLAFLIYSAIYFIIVALLSLYPSKLLKIIGFFLAPIKIGSLIILIFSIFLISSKNHTLISPTTPYNNAPFSNGFLNGYLTMDALGALVFGSVVISSMKFRGIQEHKLLMRYTIIAGIIASIGLTIVYISLFKLGYIYASLIDQHSNGISILNRYIHHDFGIFGDLFFSVLIIISCIVTSVGLTCAWADFFSKTYKLNYKLLVCILSCFSMLLSSIGLNILVQFSIPVLTIIYPIWILLIMLSFTKNWWYKSERVFKPTILVSFIFSILDSLKTIFYNSEFLVIHFPFMVNISWILPVIIVLIICAVVDLVKGYS